MNSKKMKIVFKAVKSVSQITIFYKIKYEYGLKIKIFIEHNELIYFTRIIRTLNNLLLVELTVCL